MPRVEIRHHGRTIRGDLTYPEKRQRLMPAVLLVHGRAVDRHYYWLPELHRRLVERGCVVLAIDLSGHGQSSGHFEQVTYSRSIQDVLSAADFLKKQKNVNPHAVGALGHSLGGTALLLAQARRAPFKALVLVAPVGDTKRHVRTAYSPAVVRAWKRTGVLSWYDQRLKKNLTAKFSFYQDYLHHDTLRSARRIHQPTLIVHGTNDAAVPVVESRRLYAALNEPKRLVVVHGAQHSFRTPIMRRQLFAVVQPWLRDYLLKRASRVVNVFIRNHGEYLIVKRSNQVGYYRGRWAIVSGHLVRGTSVLAQAYHEAREEAGLRRSDLKLIRVGPTVKRIDADIGKTWLITSVLMESSTRRVCLDWEHTAHKWVAIQRFPFKQSYPGIEKQFVALGL